MHNLWGTNGLQMIYVFLGSIHTISQVWTLFSKEGTRHSWDSYCNPWGQELRTIAHLPSTVSAPALDFHGHLWPRRDAAVRLLRDMNLKMPGSNGIRTSFHMLSAEKEKIREANAGQSSRCQGKVQTGIRARVNVGRSKQNRQGWKDHGGMWMWWQGGLKCAREAPKKRYNW